MLLAIAESDLDFTSEQLDEIVDYLVRDLDTRQEIESAVVGEGYTRTQGVNITSELYLRACLKGEQLRPHKKSWYLAEYMHNIKRAYADPHRPLENKPKYIGLGRAEAEHAYREYANRLRSQGSVQTATYFMAESAFTAELRSSFQPLSAIFERELQAIR
ncbi:MAG: hypothetical protein Q7V63_00040, partial [Gammaproteobacteria bacterium]|nr:hypothetical protein [Gammaproteobacteria bacterium]